MLTYDNKARYESKAKEIHGAHKRGIWQSVPQYVIDEGKQELAEAQQRHKILLLAREQNAKFAPKEEKL